MDKDIFELVNKEIKEFSVSDDFCVYLTIKDIENSGIKLNLRSKIKLKFW